MSFNPPQKQTRPTKYVDERDVKITWQSIFSSVCTFYNGVEKITIEDAEKKANEIWLRFCTRPLVQEVTNALIDNLPDEEKKEVLEKLNSSQSLTMAEVDLRDKLNKDLTVTGLGPKTSKTEAPPKDDDEPPF